MRRAPARAVHNLPSALGGHPISKGALAQWKPPRAWRAPSTPGLLRPAALLIFALVTFAVALPQTAQALFGQVQNWIVGNASWFYEYWPWR